MTPEQLLAKYVETRDEAAFEELHEKNAPSLLAVARRFARPSDVDDVTQAAWMRLLALGHLRKGTVKQALRVFAFEAAVMIGRRASTRGDESHEALECLVDQSGTPEEAAIMAQALNGLTEPERAVIELVALKGATVTRAAHVLGMAQRTTERRLRDGLTKLATAYGQEEAA